MIVYFIVSHVLLAALLGALWRHWLGASDEEAWPWYGPSRSRAWQVVAGVLTSIAVVGGAALFADAPVWAAAILIAAPIAWLTLPSHVSAFPLRALLDRAPWTWPKPPVVGRKSQLHNHEWAELIVGALAFGAAALLALLL